jgi:hypothetical protein
MSARKTRLVDCNPRWGTFYGERTDRYITFDCPEGHADCHHTIPFSPMLDDTEWGTNMAVWQRVGTDFATLTITPSIARRPTDHDPCAMHVEITKGEITFAGDSR